MLDFSLTMPLMTKQHLKQISYKYFILSICNIIIFTRLINRKIQKFSVPRTSIVVLGNLLGKTPIFQALRYWKILFSPSDFEPTSVRNCQFLTQPVRNCQHADPYQVLGLERSGRERTSSFRNSELDLWRILEYSGHLIILLFKGPFKFCKTFKSLNI